MAAPDSAAPASDAPASAEPAPDGPPAAASKRLSRILIAAGVALVLVLSVGIFVGYRLMFPPIQPAEHMPASVVGYLAVDLDPGFQQQAKLLQLGSRMSGTKLAPDAKGMLDEALRAIDPGLKDIDLKRDLMSWLGLRVGLGIWLDSTDRVYAVIVAANRDDNAATQGLASIAKNLRGVDLGYVLRDDVAIIAIGERDAQQAAQAASAESQQSPLSSAATFTAAMQWLDDDQVLLAFADMDRYGNLMTSMLGSDGPQLMESERLSQQYRGTSVLGVRATDDGIEARYRSFDDATVPEGISDAIDRLGALPQNSSLAAVTKLPDDLDKQANSPLSTIASALALSAAQPQIPPFDPAEFSSEDVTEFTVTDIEALNEFDPVDLDRGIDANDTLTKITQAFEALSGATLGFVLVGEFGADPQLQLYAEAMSADKANVLGALAQDIDATFAVDIVANKVTMASPGYSSTTGTLAQDETFKLATAGGPADVTMAAYLNLVSAVPRDRRKEIGAIKAVGMVQGVEDGDQVTLVRVLIS